MNRQRRWLGEFGSDMALYGLIAALSGSAGLFLLPFLTNTLSLQEYGSLDILIISWVILATILEMALPGALQRYYFEAEDPESRKKMVGTVFWVITAATTVTVMVIWVFSGALALALQTNPPTIMLAGLAAGLAAITIVPITVLRLERRILLVGASRLLYLTVFITLAVTLVTGTGLGLSGVVAAAVAAKGIQAIGVITVAPTCLSLSFSVPDLRRMMRYAVPNFPAVLLGAVDTQLDRFLVLGFLSLSDVGIYGAAAKIATVVGILGSIVRRSWLPYSMQLLKENRADRDQFYSRILAWYFVALTMASLVLTAVSPEIFQLLPSQYRGGLLALPLLAGTRVLRHGGSIANQGIVLGAKTHLNSAAALASVVITAGVGFLLIPHFGFVGASAATFSAQAVAVGLLARWSTRVSTVSYDLTLLGQLLVVYLVAGGLIVYFGHAAAFEFASLVTRGVLAGTGCGVVFKLVQRSDSSITLKTLRQLAVDGMSGLFEVATGKLDKK